jgi:hypothetical protein
LWFAHALVYHARQTPEHQPLVDFIRATVREAEQSQVQIMGKTIAEDLEEKGEAAGILKGKREALLLQLRIKFKRVPPAVVAEIEAAQEGSQLDEWLEAVITAGKISDIPFQSSKKK